MHYTVIALGLNVITRKVNCGDSPNKLELYIIYELLNVQGQSFVHDEDYLMRTDSEVVRILRTTDELKTTRSLRHVLSIKIVTKCHVHREGTLLKLNPLIYLPF